MDQFLFVYLYSIFYQNQFFFLYIFFMGSNSYFVAINILIIFIVMFMKGPEYYKDFNL